MNYSLTRDEVIAFKAIPNVLKKGIEIGQHENHKRRSYKTITFAAPVEIDGVRMNLAVVVKQTKGNIYKVHKALLANKNAQKKQNRLKAYEGVDENISLVVANGSAETNIAQENKDSQAESFKMSSDFEETDRFIAWHNMNEDALSSALELGGLAMPSFAVKAANTAHSDYGPISVIAEKDSIAPNGRDQILFAGDAWTPVFPEVNYKINESETDRIYDHIYSILQKAGVNPSEFHIGLDSSNLRDKLQRNNGSFSAAMESNDGMKLAFLKDSGIGIDIPSTEEKFSQYASNETLKRIAKEFDLSHLDSDKIRALEPELRELIHEDAKTRKGERYADLLYPLDQPLDFSKADNILRNAVRISEAASTKEVDTYALKDRIKEIMTPEVEKRYTAWLDTLGKDVIAGKGIRNNVDTYTANGNRRSFDQLHYEYNLSNIIRAMRSQPRQGRTQVFSGPGSVNGAALKNYKDIEAARADMNRLSKKEQIKISEKYTSFNDHVLELSNKVAKDPFTGSEILAEILSHAKTKDQIMHYMVKEYSGVFKATNALTNEIYALGQEANDLPIEYFEAKLYRAFPITEAAAYIVPDNMDQDLRQRLEETGANVLQYEAGNEEDRLEKANSVPEARFSSEFEEVKLNQGAGITVNDIKVLRSIGRKSISAFTDEEIQKSGAWARKFYAELHEKSPFFRRWFGDWRSEDQSKVNIVGREIEPIPYSAGKTINEDTGKSISWGEQLKGETRIHLVRGGTGRSLDALGKVRGIVSNAVLLDTVVSDNSSKRKMPNTAFMHSFYSIYQDESGSYLLKLYAEEALSNNEKDVFTRAYELNDIEAIGQSVQSNNDLTRAIASVNTVADLYALVKQFDKDFTPSPKKVQKEFLNEDGTPKVFYHGAKQGGGFSTFRNWQYFTSNIPILYRPPKDGLKVLQQYTEGDCQKEESNGFTRLKAAFWGVKTGGTKKVKIFSKNFLHFSDWEKSSKKHLTKPDGFCIVAKYAAQWGIKCHALTTETGE